MPTYNATVVSVHVGCADTLDKEAREAIEVEFDGIVGDRHQSFTRACWEGDKQPEGTRRRNERQWSAVSVEELAAISDSMDLAEPLQASTVGANLCLEGVSNLSRLPRGTQLKFPSGAQLMVEEYNPPCSDMGKKVAREHTGKSGSNLAASAFSNAAKFSRGVVGVVEATGRIAVGDEVIIETERLPKWLRDKG
jgi:MOSC domain-containing protein YiiM